MPCALGAVMQEQKKLSGRQGLLCSWGSDAGAEEAVGEARSQGRCRVSVEILG
jgi:hypothetical protein